MITTSGLPASMALQLIQRERDTFEDSVAKNPLNAREIDAFRNRIGSITTVDQLVEDYEVYSFVMKAFDLESQIFGKAMMKKVLASDSSEPGALINRMTDSRFKELHRELGFSENGKANTNTQDPAWVEKIVDRYFSQKIINNELQSNEVVGNALHFKSKAEKLTSWYSVLADTKLQDFFYTALGLPDAMKKSDIDAQASLLRKKFDLETLSDPGVMDKLISRYAAIGEARNVQKNLANNPILQLFSSSTSSQSSIISINLDGLSALRSGRY